jgi:rubrerythrin
MGQEFLFRCPDCGFETNVSGGHDMGMACVTQTYSCAECGGLFDFTVSEAPWAFDPKDTPKTVPCRMARRPAKHTATLWEHPGPCPVCGATLSREDEPTVLWD